MSIKILFATDGRRPSFLAERSLTSVGDRSSLEVTVLTVGNPQGRVMRERGESAFDPSGLEAAFIAEAAGDRLRTSGFSVDTDVPCGSPADEISRSIRTGTFGLLLLGAGRYSPGKETPISPLAAQILRSSSSSVMLVRATIEQPATAVFWQDGSLEASRALESFLNFADPERCNLIVVAVRRKRKLASSGTSIKSRSRPREPFGASDSRVRDLAESTTEFIRERGFEIKELLAFDSPSQARAGVADNFDYSIVVSGVEHVRWLKRFRFAPLVERATGGASASFMATSSE